MTDPAVSTSTNRITNRTGELYEFDASGNMTKDALGNRSVYDIENHQTEYFYSTNSGSTPDAKYYYDGDGKRVKKVVGTETTIFVYDAGGKLVAEYTIGVTANPSPQTSYITTDTLGSTRLVTSGSGHVIARHDYLPFGDEIYGLGGRTSAQGFSQPDTTRQRFTGYEHDTETGLDFAQARYYGNGLGRFTGVDPVGESAKISSPQSWNRYIYSHNSPLRYSDPTGMSPDWVQTKDEMIYDSRVVDQETATALYGDGAIYRPLYYAYTSTLGFTVLGNDGSYLENGKFQKARDHASDPGDPGPCRWDANHLAARRYVGALVHWEYDPKVDEFKFIDPSKSTWNYNQTTGSYEFHDGESNPWGFRGKYTIFGVADRLNDAGFNRFENYNFADHPNSTHFEGQFRGRYYHVIIKDGQWQNFSPIGGVEMHAEEKCLRPSSFGHAADHVYRNAVLPWLPRFSRYMWR